MRADRSIARHLVGPISTSRSPGLFAAVYDAQGVREAAVAGVRKQGAEPPVTVADRVHVGSNTKAMTSVMLATLVADGTFSDGWQTTVGDVFPELLDEVHAGYHRVTLRQLISMSGGVTANARDWSAYGELPVVERRVALVKDNLAAAPPVAPGECRYSNLSYVVAAAMAERLTDRSWETLMRERVFAPLGMAGAGFGNPGEAGGLDEPWGHRRNPSGEWEPNQEDNVAALGPAGVVHLTLEDWATFAGLWLSDGRRIGLAPDALNELIAPVARISRGEAYAGGWIVTERRWGGGRVLTHAGSNTSWYAVIWIAPKLGRAYVAVANSADGRTPGVLDAIIGKLIQDARPARRFRRVAAAAAVLRRSARVPPRRSDG